MWNVARRPRWIAALVLALGVAVGFALLGQWQLARSIDSATVVERATETVVELASVAEPGGPVASSAAGQLVSVDGAFIASDYTVVGERRNGDAVGYWVVGHVETDDGPSLAVALGWAATEAAAASALAEVNGAEINGAATNGAASQAEVRGRYLPTEAPQGSDFENGKQNNLSVAALINLWKDAPSAVYAGFIVSSNPPAGLDAIDSPAPSSEVTLNWLNLFYAAEWVVFAGFAIFLWYRLVRDAWEREQERPT